MLIIDPLSLQWLKFCSDRIMFQRKKKSNSLFKYEENESMP